MSTSPATPGRRERNKQQKLERIVAAAADLFAERGVDDVTTTEIAERADIGTGTLFLYAKNKGELLLLVQNGLYEKALARGREASAPAAGTLEGLLAVIRPIVECNRVHVENGRTYLREMVFGDPNDPQHAAALGIVLETQQLFAKILQRQSRLDDQQAATLAPVVSAIMFVTMAASINAAASVEELIQQITDQVRVILPSTV
ncbi:MAG: TetR/AcrR family transcriptional regulator [Propionibacteriaceae bacterium]|nr:TetR/AcrR family transcriptional regulator [Micropruina sp.]HBX81031.1 TetR family transcriptional regulator [Propionibacteriaceae bacterium]